jgi:rare lipoprotein A
MLFLLGAAPAQAMTGGASPLAASEAQLGGEAQLGAEVAFGPLRPAGATWYGPGFYGNQTACGPVLRPGTIGVAHRRLPCGTPVKFVYRGRQLVTRVIDRGPYSAGHTWDLTNGARQALGFEGSGRVLFAVGLEYARADRRRRG